MSGFCGVDPGLDGCVAVIENNELCFFDTPTMRGPSTRRMIDVAACAVLIRRLKADWGPLTVGIERVGSMPGMGNVSAFSFGFGFGVWIGILAALEIPYTLVSPVTWKRAMCPNEAKNKDASRVVARRLWPVQTEEYLSRKKDHNRADSALIAEYIRRKFLGKVA